MGKTSKSFVFFFILIIAISSISLMMVKPVSAQTIPTPSVPQFTLHLQGPSFVQNTTYYLDSNTGQILAKIGYTNPYSYLEVTINNQLPDNTYGNPYYDIRMKFHNATNWTDVAYSPGQYYPYERQSNDTNYSEFGFSIEQTNAIGTLADSKVDVQVQAIYGYVGGLNVTSDFQSHWGWITESTSGWSNTQTIPIPANTPLTSGSSTPTSTPTVPEFSWLTILPLSIFMLFIAVTVRLRKTWRTTQH